MTDVANNYQIALDTIIGGEGRLSVGLIHDDEDLCVRSTERELLHTIHNVQRELFGVEWSFREKLYGKSLVLPMDQQVAPIFTGFAYHYKRVFQKRITMITDQYDMATLDEEKTAFYEQVKADYVHLLEEPIVDFKKYKQVRELFERVRYQNA